MLDVYPVVLDWVVAVRGVVDQVAVRDRHLADQLSRSSSSVVLNLAEGMGGFGAVKRNSYRVALREMRESVAAVDLATRLGLATPLDDVVTDKQSRIVGTLVRLAMK